MNTIGLEENLAKIFNIDVINQIKYIEGIIWSKWNKYENNEIIINFIKEKLRDKYIIRNYTFLRYKYNINNPKMLLIEIDLIIDRNIKLLLISNGNYNEVIIAKYIEMININNNDDKNDTNEKILNLEIEYNLLYKILKEY